MIITIKDVAERAGVSFSLVSAVLGKHRNPPNVRPETRKRIEDAAQQLGYRRNALASQMQSGSTNHITLISGNFSEEFSARVIDGALGEAESFGYYLKLASIPVNSGNLRAIDRVIEQRPAAIISANDDRHFIDYLNKAATELKIPLARVDAYNDIPGIPRVLSDDWQGALKLAEHLNRCGCRRIGLAAVPYIYPYERMRLKQFLAAADEFKLTVDPELVFRGNSDQMLSTLDRLKKCANLPDALLCCSDSTALTALTHLTRRGIDVPGQIKVTGFSDFSFSILCRPQVTTVRQEYEEMGRTVVRILLAALQNEASSAGDIFVPTELKIRTSTSQGSQV